MAMLKRGGSDPTSWQGTMPITSRYTAGVAGERFFRALKDEGRILGSHCPECDVLYVPARQFCERCLCELVDWSDVGTEGYVHTYTLMFENVDGTPRTEPEIVAFVELGDGGIIHRLREVEPEDVYIGMHVVAVMKPTAEREGSILDIAYFRPSG
jgi:hypothetical protein